MTDLKDLPMRLMSGDVDRWLVLRVLHFVGEDEQVVFYISKASWGRFALGGVADGWHFALFSSLPMLDFKLQSGRWFFAESYVRLLGRERSLWRGRSREFRESISQPWAWAREFKVLT
jgi:hypothetical protein